MPLYVKENLAVADTCYQTSAQNASASLTAELTIHWIMVIKRHLNHPPVELQSYNAELLSMN